MVPAEAVTPLVRVAVVGGVDPLLDPSAYPITTKADTPQPEVHRVTVVGDIMLGRRVGAAAAAATWRSPRSDERPPVRRRPDRRQPGEHALDAGPPQQGDDSFDADPRCWPGWSGRLRRAVAGQQPHRRLRRAGPARRPCDGSTRRRHRAVSAPGRTWLGVAAARSSSAGGVTFGFLAFNAIGETPRACPGDPARPRSAHAAPHRTARPRRPPPSHRRSSGDSTSASTSSSCSRTGATSTRTSLSRSARGRLARLLDAGADLVVGGHPHWVQGIAVPRRTGWSCTRWATSSSTWTSRADPAGGHRRPAFRWGDRIKAVRFTPYVDRS